MYFAPPQNPIGLLYAMQVVTHGKLAEHFIDAMEHVVGKQHGVATICIGPNDDMERRRADTAAGDAGEGEDARRRFPGRGRRRRRGRSGAASRLSRRGRGSGGGRRVECLSFRF